MVGAPAFLVAVVVIGIHHLEIRAHLELGTDLFQALGNDFGTAHQDGGSQPFFQHNLDGPQHPLVFPFRIDDALGLALLGGGEYGTHAGPGVAVEFLQLVPIGFPVRNGPGGHAGIHGGLGHGGGDDGNEAGIEGLGNQVARTEGQVQPRIGHGHFVAHLFLGQGGNGFDTGQLHFFRNALGPHIQGAPENKGEAKDVINLVGVVGTARGGNSVGTDFLDQFRHDFRSRVGQGEDQGILGHGLDHFLLQHTGGGQAKEHIRVGNGVPQGTGSGFPGEAGLVGLHLFVPAHVNHALGIANGNVFPLDPQFAPQIQTGDGGSAGTGGHHLHFGGVLAHHLQAIQHGGGGNDGGPVLVIMEDRDGHPFLQLLLNVEALRRLDVFQINPAQGRFQGSDHFDQLVRVLFGDFNVEDVDASELLKQATLAFHHRLGGQGADVAQAQHGGPVGHHPHQIAPGGHFIHGHRIGHDFLAGIGHAGGIGQGQIPLVGQALGGLNGNLPRSGKAVVFKSCVAQVLFHQKYLEC